MFIIQLNPYKYDQRNFYDAYAFIVSLTFTYIHICRDKCRKMYFHNGGCECYLVYNISDMSRMYYKCNVKGCFSGRLFRIFRVSVMSYNIAKLFRKLHFFAWLFLSAIREKMVKVNFKLFLHKNFYISCETFSHIHLMDNI